MDTTRTYTPDQKHFFERKDLGESPRGSFEIEITTSFKVDGTDFFKLADGDAYFRDNNTFVIFDYRGIVIYFIAENEAMHLFRSAVDAEPKISIKVDASDRNRPIAVLSTPRAEDIRLDIFKSLYHFSPGRNFF